MYHIIYELKNIRDKFHVDVLIFDMKKHILL